MEVLIDINEIQNRMVILENNKIKKFYIENIYDKDICDNIYVGKIKGLTNKNKLAFVDIGFKEDAIMPLFSNNYKLGEDILVQVNREGKINKGPRLRDNISIKGKYIILTLNDNNIVIAKNNKYFDNIDSSTFNNKYGFIIRSNSKKEDLEQIKREYLKLESIAESIKRNYRYIKAPKLLYDARDFLDYIVREFIDKDISKIIINNRNAFRTLSENNSFLSDKIILDENIKYKVDDLLNNNCNTKLKLKSGGNIVVNFTEACTVIDVNSSDSTNLNSLIETNIEACEKIIEIIKLYDLTGNIIVDFIDMDIKDRKNILNILENGFNSEKIEIKILGFTRLGMLEMTRQRYGKNFFEKYYIDVNNKIKSPYTYTRELELSILKNNINYKKIGVEKKIYEAYKKFLNDISSNFKNKYRISIDFVPYNMNDYFEEFK